MFKHTIDFPPLVKNSLIVAAIISLVTTNPLLTLVSILFLPLAAKLLWRKNEPPILFLAVAMQWIQVTIKVFQADFLFVDITTVVTYPENIVSAYYLGMAGLVALALGINTALKNSPTTPKKIVKENLSHYNSKRLVFIYAASILVVLVLAPISFYFAGLQQFITKLMDFKWSIFFMLYLVVFYRNSNRLAFFAILSFEIVLGFTGFFSNFKEFFLIAVICFLFIKERLKIKEYVIIGTVFIVLINLMVVWQYVKQDYRRFLSGGERSQNVTVSSGEALDKLGDIVSEVEVENYDDGLTQFIDRIAYIDLFSATINYTPRNIAHEDGALWANAIKNILMPRFLFPNKANIDDSEKTKKYTGLEFAGAELGTSISLGYVTETYIDFGYLLFIPLFFFGLIIGWIYNYIVKNSINVLWGYALTIPLFFQLYTFEIALDKIVGGLIAYFLVYLLVRKFFVKTMHVYLVELVGQHKN